MNDQAPMTKNLRRQRPDKLSPRFFIGRLVGARREAQRRKLPPDALPVPAETARLNLAGTGSARPTHCVKKDPAPRV